MTCIIGIKKDNEVWIGGDRAAGNLYECRPVTHSKVFRNGDAIMGYTTSFRMGQLLQYHLSIPKYHKDEDLLKYIHVDFLNAVRSCMKDNGFAKITSNEEESGEFLMAINGRLFLIQDFHALEYQDGFDAVGCGATYAKGSLFSTQDMEPEDRIKMALKAASHFSPGVLGPYDIFKN